MAKKVATPEPQPQQEKTIADKLMDLRALQAAYSSIDHIKTLRGELPLEVRDKEDEIIQRETRLTTTEAKLKEYAQTIAAHKAEMAEAQTSIERYNQQLTGITNVKEESMLRKEIEFQEGRILLARKRIGEITDLQAALKGDIEALQAEIALLQEELKIKKDELEQIKSETKTEEEGLRQTVKDLEEVIEERLLRAFHRIREGARNGLAVVSVERDACGGCFNKIPPQRQLDIKLHKKVIVCEYCGRIMVDSDLGVAHED